MGKFAKAVRRNQDLINSFMGSVDNIRATVRFKDVMNDFGKMEQERNEQMRFGEITNRLRGVELTEDDAVVEERSFNPGFVISNSKSYKDYDMFKIMDQTYEDYLEKFKDRYPDEYEKAYKVNLREASPEDIEMRMFEKAGLQPEDVEFFNTYKQKMKDERMPYNARLKDMMYKNMPGLYSRGSMGSRLQEDAYRIGENMMIPEMKPPEWQFLPVGDNVMKINKSEGSYELIEGINAKEKRNVLQDQILNNIGYRIVEDEDGKLWFEFPTEDGWERKNLPATEEQYAKWIDGYNTLADQLEIREGFRPPRLGGLRSGRGNSSKKGSGTSSWMPNIGKMTLSERGEFFSNVKVSDLDPTKMKKSDLDMLWKNRDKLSDEVIEKLVKLKYNGSITDDDDEKIIGPVRNTQRKATTEEEMAFKRNYDVAMNQVEEAKNQIRKRVNKEINHAKQQLAGLNAEITKMIKSGKYSYKELQQNAINAMIKYYNDNVDRWHPWTAEAIYNYLVENKIIQ